jgi:putative spermidine/putrescine transport system permease protein
MSSVGGMASGVQTWRPGRRRTAGLRRRRSGVFLRIVGFVVGVWLVAPMLVVIPMSFTGQASFVFPPPSWSTRWYVNLFSNPVWTDALKNSFEIAVLVTVCATILGTAAAFGMDRGRIPGKSLVSAVLVAPMIMPIVVLAIGVYALFLRWHLVGTIPGFVAAHTALAVPFVFITVSASLQTFDRQLEAAAASLGASPWSTFWRVTLPLILPGVLTGALFAFNTSFDELVVAIFLVSPTTVTLPVQIYESVTRNIDPTVAAASSVLLAFTTTLLVIGLTIAWRRSKRALTRARVA